MTEQAGLPNEGRVASAVVRGHAAGHVVPARVLIGVWAALLVLTVATVTVTWKDFGPGLNLWIAMGVATVKAALVLLYFMHLRYDRPVNAIFFIFALFFVALFIGGAMTDSQHYQSELIRGYAPEMNK
jgi:cytochrome c oxidase subunit 4